MEIKNIAIDSIIPYEFNNKKHDEEQINLLVNSINEFGFKNPILIDESNIILAGHGRYEAAKKIGLEEIPSIQVTDLDEIKKKRYRILDNRITDYAEYDTENLKIELEAIGDEFMNNLFIDLHMELEDPIDIDPSLIQDESSGDEQNESEGQHDDLENNEREVVCPNCSTAFNV